MKIDLALLCPPSKCQSCKWRSEEKGGTYDEGGGCLKCGVVWWKTALRDAGYDEEWDPTEERIGALPSPVRKYVRELERQIVRFSLGRDEI